MAQWYHTCSLARGIQDRIPGTPSVIIKQNTSVALGLVSSIQADVKVSGKCSIVGHTRSVVWRMLLADKNGQNTDLPCSNLLFSVIFGFLVKFYIRISLHSSQIGWKYPIQHSPTHPYLSHANTQFFGLGSAFFALGSAFFAHSDPGSCVIPYFDLRIPYFDLRMAFAWIWAHDWGRGVKQPKNFFQNFQISWFVRIFNKKNHNFSFTFEIRLSFCTGVKWRVSFCTGVKWRMTIRI